MRKKKDDDDRSLNAVEKEQQDYILELQRKIDRSEEEIRKEIAQEYEGVLKRKDEEKERLEKKYKDSQEHYEKMKKRYKNKIQDLQEENQDLQKKIQELQERPQNKIKSGNILGKRGRKPLPDETKQQIISLKAEGKTVKEITKELGVSKGSVYWATHPEAAAARRKGSEEK